jgi:hypothetical protein
VRVLLPLSNGRSFFQHGSHTHSFGCGSLAVVLAGWFQIVWPVVSILPQRNGHCRVHVQYVKNELQESEFDIFTTSVSDSLMVVSYIHPEVWCMGLCFPLHGSNYLNFEWYNVR